MPRILVIYGTSTGHTRKVARTLGKLLRSQYHHVDVVEAGVTAVDPGDYAGIIVAASVRAGKYQKPVHRWVEQHAPMLNKRPSAFVSVSLGVLQAEPKVQAHVAAIVNEFLRATGWRPWTTRNVAGALLYTKYNLLTRWFMKRIAAKAGGDTDTSRDYEYTDWADVRAFAAEFERLIRIASPIADEEKRMETLRAAG